MKQRTSMVAALVIVLVVGAFSFFQPRAQTQAVAAPIPQQRQQGGFEYSRLVKDSSDLYVWNFGEQILGRNRPLTVEQMTRQVNVNGTRVVRPSIDTLLNNFGEQGWDIFWIESSEDGASTTWYMKRTKT